MIKGKDPVLGWGNLYSITKFPGGTIGTNCAHYNIPKDLKIKKLNAFILEKNNLCICYNAIERKS